MWPRNDGEQHGMLRRTGRVVEADIDLCGEPGGIRSSRGVVDSDPEAIAAFVRSKAPGAVRIGLRQDRRPHGCGPSSYNLACR